MLPDHDPDEVTADDQLLEDLRDGARPPTGDQVAAALAAMRDQARADDSPIFRDLATERPITLPEVFGDDPATTMLPTGRVEYGGSVDWAWPPWSDPTANTAGQQDHTDPWTYAGEPADPPGPS